MAKYKIWNRTFPLTCGMAYYATAQDFANSDIGKTAMADPTSKWVIDDNDNNRTGCFMSFEILKSIYTTKIAKAKEAYPTEYTGSLIVEGMSDTDILAAIEYNEDNPIYEPSAEERIVAQLEYQNIINS